MHRIVKVPCKQNFLRERSRETNNRQFMNNKHPDRSGERDRGGGGGGGVRRSTRAQERDVMKLDIPVCIFGMIVTA